MIWHVITACPFRYFLLFLLFVTLIMSVEAGRTPSKPDLMRFSFDLKKLGHRQTRKQWIDTEKQKYYLKTPLYSGGSMR
ncbi:MAG: hypothetical protein D6726_06360 [Nitrospirae bacterium]|nr:MAG: hypothetical protein D6726_06360 [Nitrospirota bacterium]